MSFFKNKHIVTAMITTPILAMLGYYLTDLVVKEQPHEPQYKARVTRWLRNLIVDLPVVNVI